MERLIKVKGIGNVKAKPDMIVINIELEAQKYEYDDTMRVAAQNTEKLERAIEHVGFNRKDLKTTSFKVNTNYKDYYDENNIYKSKFDGYKCEQGMLLQFDLNMELLSSLLNEIAKIDVNPKLDIKFSVKDKDAIKEQLLISATINARKEAEILAKAAKVNLGRLITIDYNLRDINIYSQTKYQVENKASMNEVSYAPNIEPDDISVSDNVAFIWEIR